MSDAASKAARTRTTNLQRVLSRPEKSSAVNPADAARAPLKPVAPANK